MQAIPKYCSNKPFPNKLVYETNQRQINTRNDTLVLPIIRLMILKIALRLETLPWGETLKPD